MQILTKKKKKIYDRKLVKVKENNQIQSNAEISKSNRKNIDSFFVDKLATFVQVIFYEKV